MDSEMKSATSSPVHLCFAVVLYCGQASYIFFSSTPVKGSRCSAVSISRPLGFFTGCAGLRIIHWLETQYSKKGLSIAIRRAPVLGLIAHEVRNSGKTGAASRSRFDLPEHRAALWSHHRHQRGSEWTLRSFP